MFPKSYQSVAALFGVVAWLFGGSGCSGPAPVAKKWVSTTQGERLILRNGRLLDGRVVDVEIRGNTIVNVGRVDGPALDIKGMWLVPAFIDSHVHMSLYPASEQLAKAGIAGVVDLASPRVDKTRSTGRLFAIRSGPMLTVTRGYPTQSWGGGGYGQESDSKAEAVAAVDALLGQGSDIIKVALGANGLPVPWLDAVVAQAHRHKVKVVVHALGREEAGHAAESKADVLAHVPMEALDQATIEKWGERAVITTLAAFGGSAEAVENLRAMREQGAITLYGTDLGNSKYVGIHPDEIELMMAAGMDGEAILQSATSLPAAFWGFAHLGAIAPGKAASFMLLAEDPIADPLAVTRASHVYIDGIRLR